jgi:hypothetical protein
MFSEICPYLVAIESSSVSADKDEELEISTENGIK